MCELPEWVEFVDCYDNRRILVRREDIFEVWELPRGRAKVRMNGDDGIEYTAPNYETVVRQLTGARAGDVVHPGPPEVGVNIYLGPRLVARYVDGAFVCEPGAWILKGDIASESSPKGS